MKYVRLTRRCDFTIGMTEMQAEDVYTILNKHPEILRLGRARPYEVELQGCKVRRWYLDCKTYNEAEFKSLIDEFEEHKLLITVSIR